jgi:hypothetical protein
MRRGTKKRGLGLGCAWLWHAATLSKQPTADLSPQNHSGRRHRASAQKGLCRETHTTRKFQIADLRFQSKEPAAESSNSGKIQESKHRPPAGTYIGLTSSISAPTPERPTPDPSAFSTRTHLARPLISSANPPVSSRGKMMRKFTFVPTSKCRALRK